MKNKGMGFILILICVCGVCLILYPAVSNYWNARHQTRQIGQYNASVEKISPEEYAALIDEAREYNKSLLERTNPFALDKKQKELYPNLLNISGNTVMGYIEIPVIGLALPIRHGTGEASLQSAVGHLEWTSLPVRGDSVHCVLSGHRGLPSSKLFTNLDKVDIGDIFNIRVLNEVMTYKVDQIRTVEPEDTSQLQIQKGKNYCTLVTCTPYGINTHRILIRGLLTEGIPKIHVDITSEAVQVNPIIVSVVVFMIALIVLSVVLLPVRGKIRRGERAYEKIRQREG